ncbi:MAG: CopG family transcriptional regulator [Acidobacteria bacterium]|nr:CopG family transcriptional regulator [Acidobacteriota bacterium]MCG3193911.1 hypothetical protein [Thermoanaerobaculia bacterium]
MKPDADANQNITLALSKNLLRKVKVLAAERGTSVSALLTSLMAKEVERDDAYRRAMDGLVLSLERARDLGTGGTIGWSRDDLHAR